MSCSADSFVQHKHLSRAHYWSLGGALSFSKSASHLVSSNHVHFSRDPCFHPPPIPPPQRSRLCLGNSQFLFQAFFLCTRLISSVAAPISQMKLPRLSGEHSRAQGGGARTLALQVWKPSSSEPHCTPSPPLGTHTTCKAMPLAWSF